MYTLHAASWQFQIRTTLCTTYRYVSMLWTVLKYLTLNLSRVGNNNFPWRKFWLLINILIFNRNFKFWSISWCLIKISIFDLIMILIISWFLITIFDEYLDFCSQFQLLIFVSEFRFLINILLFDHNFNFWTNYYTKEFLSKLVLNKSPFNNRSHLIPARSDYYFVISLNTFR